MWVISEAVLGVMHYLELHGMRDWDRKARSGR